MPTVTGRIYTDGCIEDKLIIGIDENVSVERLAPVVKSFHDDYQDLQVDLRRMSAENLHESINNSTIDVGLHSSIGVRSTHNTDSHILRTHLWSDSMKVAVGGTGPFIDREKVYIWELAEFPCILPKQNSVIRQWIDKIFFSYGIVLNVVMEAHDFTAIRSLISAEMGWAFLPTFELQHSLSVLPVDELDLSYSVAVIANQEKSMSRATDAFIESLPAPSRQV